MLHFVRNDDGIYVTIFTMEDIYDLVIIGAGPSALTAAIYAAREDIKTLLIEKGVVGGLMATIDNIENYPGFPDGIEGLHLAEDFQKQAEKFGAQIEMFTTVEKIECHSGLDSESIKSDNKILKQVQDDKKIFKITTDNGVFSARAVLIASGNTYRKLGIPNEELVHYCATCDGAMYRGKKLVVIGGANAAVQEAMFLTKFADHIDLLVRSVVKASEILQKELTKYVADGKIAVHEQTAPDEILVEGEKVIGVKSGDKVFDCDGVFVFAGVIPNTDFLDGSGVELDETGHIKTDHELMTNVRGIFASGDVRSGATKQVASAVGEGVTAAISIREFLK